MIFTLRIMLRERDIDFQWTVGSNEEADKLLGEILAAHATRGLLRAKGCCFDFTDVIGIAWDVQR
tara:strand:+ start:177 stop:371 length:195 start_codon:yes stop_codon:yes gene_type:complete